HLQLGTPSRWYMAHLTSDDGMNVAGFLIPGLPVILSGRTPELAWGITNGMADECDYFVEKLDSTGTKYILPNGSSRKFEIIHDTIRVRDTTRASDNSTTDPLRAVPFQVQLTIHGPVMTGMHPDSSTRSFHGDDRAGGIPNRSIFNKPNRPVAMMWNGTYALSDELAGWLALPHAKSAAEARNGMSGFATPCLNLCLADAKGNISYQYIGRLPKRAGSLDERSSNARLMLPRDGSSPEDQWQGFLYMRDLPTVTNPARGYIVSANNPPGSSIAFGLDWEPDSRADRISELLQTSTAALGAASARSIQTDIISPYDLRRVLPYLLDLYPNPNPPSIAPDSTSAFRLDSMRLYWKEDSLIRHTAITDSVMKLIYHSDSLWIATHRPSEDTMKPSKLDPFTAQVLTYLRNWDGGMRADEIAPAIYSVFLNRLLFNTFRDALGTQRYAEFIYLDNISLQTLADILPDTANIWWRRPFGTHGNMTTSRDSIIRTSFRESLRILALTFGRDIRMWQWGRLHTLTFRHPFDKASKLIARLVDIPAGAMPGGPTTVLQGTYYLWHPYEMQIGPSMRMITDMKDPVLYGVLPTGNSEAIFGDHYKDMLPLYQSGALVRISLIDRNPNWKRFELLAQGG
ncbi:MAG: penicillin acylase family protein, partial [Candidatus Kapaibacterium sp.]